MIDCDGNLYFSMNYFIICNGGDWRAISLLIVKILLDCDLLT